MGFNSGFKGLILVNMKTLLNQCLMMCNFCGFQRSTVQKQSLKKKE